MYYNKELFVNEEIKAKYKQKEKLLTVLLLSLQIPIIVITLAIIITLVIKFPKTFMIGYAMAVFASILFAVIYAISFPFQKKFDLLRSMQVEVLSGQPIYEKYIELLNLGRKLNKVSNFISIGTTIISIIAVWVLAIFFPYCFFNVYACTLPTIASNILLLTRSKRIKQIKSTEEEILRELHKNDENKINHTQEGE